MEKNNGWKSRFCIVKVMRREEYWLLVEHGHQFSYNCIIYKTEGGAKKGARAAFNKINKEFEKIILS